MGSLVILFLTKHVNNVKKQLGIVPVYYVFVVDIRYTRTNFKPLFLYALYKNRFA
jgi:hypothetical protein